MSKMKGQRRNRGLLIVTLVATIALGLLTRSDSTRIPFFVAIHAGDALWTVAVYLTLAVLFPTWSAIRLGSAAFLVSCCVECSQLLDVHWLNAIRATLPGRLLLGSGFLPIDFLRYLVGALLAALLDLGCRELFSRER